MGFAPGGLRSRGTSGLQIVALLTLLALPSVYSLLPLDNTAWTCLTPQALRGTLSAGSTNYGEYQVESSTNCPAPTSTYGCTASTTDAQGRKYLWRFGGENTAATNALWRLNLTSGHWTWMSGTNQSYPTAYTGDPAFPLPRRHCTLIGGVDKLYLFGGFQPALYPAHINDLWSWNFGTQAFEMLRNYTADRHPFGFETKTFNALAQISARRYAIGFVDEADGLVYIYGGAGYDFNTSSLSPDVRLSDLWAYDPGLGQYSFIEGSVYEQSRAPSYPGGRFDAQWAFHQAQRKFILYGGEGSDSNQLLADMWVFSTATKTWTSIDESRGVLTAPAYPASTAQWYTEDVQYHPGSRSTGQGWVDESNGAFFLYGGKYTQIQGYCADLWRYNFTTNHWMLLHRYTVGTLAPAYPAPFVPLPSPGRSQLSWGLFDSSAIYFSQGFAESGYTIEVWKYAYVTPAPTAPPVASPSAKPPAELPTLVNAKILEVFATSISTYSTFTQLANATLIITPLVSVVLTVTNFTTLAGNLTVTPTLNLADQTTVDVINYQSSSQLSGVFGFVNIDDPFAQSCQGSRAVTAAPTYGPTKLSLLFTVTSSGENTCESQAPESNAGAIAGGIVGALVALVIVFLLIAWLVPSIKKKIFPFADTE